MKLETVIKHMLDDPGCTIAYRKHWVSRAITIEPENVLIEFSSNHPEVAPNILYRPSIDDLLAKDWLWER